MMELSAYAGKFRRYVRSPSTRIAAFGGLMMYVSYAYAHGSWANPALIGVSVFAGVFLPSYSKLSNKAELWANNQFGFVTAGKLGRFLPQLAFNLAVIWLCFVGGAFNLAGIASVGGWAGAALLTTLASQGTQYLGGYLVARGIGDANRNTIVSIVFNMVLAGLGTAGAAGRARGLPDPGLCAGRAVLRRRPAVGPALRAGAQGRHRVVLRNLQSVPQFTSDDRSAGAGRAAARPHHHPSDAHPASARRRLPQGRDPRGPGLEDGFQIYEKTDKADSNVDYFPTGNIFLPPETRKALIELALAEAGLGNRVEVAFYPETYNTKGFQGVIGEVKRRHPGARLHTLHGTDFGGMLVRQISDECGWIYPWRILRRDKVSATAIRTRRQGHDVAGRDRRAFADFAESSGGDGWGPPLPERQRSTYRGGLA